MTPAIGLADLIRAIAQLAPRGDDPDAIARILGRAPPAAVAAVAPSRVAPAPQAAGATGDAPSTATGQRSTPAVTPQTAAPVRSVERGPVSLRPLGRPETPPPAWLPPPRQGLDPATPPAPPATLDTLFEPRRHRALLGAALATFDHAGPLDLERLLEQVATRRPGRSLPRLPEATLRRGAWLLLDRSPAMAPFFDDVTDLAARIERVVGREATRVQQFLAGPEYVWDAAALDERALELPPPGTPLVAITELGVRSGAQAWRPLLRRLAGRGNRAIAIVPYRAARVPAELRRLAALVPWDRSARVGAVRLRRRSAR